MHASSTLSTRLSRYRSVATRPVAAIAAASAWGFAGPASTQVNAGAASSSFVELFLTNAGGSFGNSVLPEAFFFNGESIRANAVLRDLAIIGYSSSFYRGFVGSTPVALNHEINSTNVNFGFDYSFHALPNAASGMYLPFKIESIALADAEITTVSNAYYGWARLGSLVGGVSNQGGTTVFAGSGFSAAAAVPEPSTALPLLLMGAVGVALNRRRKQAAA